MKSCKQDNTHGTLYILELLKKVMGILTIPIQKKLCEGILRLPSLGISFLTVLTFNVLASLFDSYSSYSPLVIPLVNALLELQPHQVETESLNSYTRAMASGYIHLSNFKHATCMKKLPQLLEQLIPTFQSNSKSVNANTAQCLQTLIPTVLTKAVIQGAFISLSQDTSKPGKKDEEKKENKNAEGKSLELEEEIGKTENDKDSGDSWEEKSTQVVVKVMQCLLVGLGYTYQNSWEFVLMVSFTFVKAISDGSNQTEEERCVFSNLLQEFTVNVASLNAQNHLVESVQKVLYVVLKIIGIQKFLSIIPLLWPSIDYSMTEMSTKSNNLWILQFLSKYLENSQLNYFYTVLYPISTKLEENSKKTKAEAKSIEAKTLSNFSLQIWKTFPRFCILPTDTPNVFPKMAPLLRNFLIQRMKLRVLVASGLQNLIKKYKNLLTSLESSEEQKNMAKESLQVVSDTCKNFLPALFQLYMTNIPATDRTQIYQVVDCFLGITDKKMVKDYFNTTAIKLVHATTSKETPALDSGENDKTLEDKKNLTDLLSVFVPYLEMTDTELMFRTIHPLIFSKEALLKKKALKVFHKICDCHRELLRSNMQNTIEILEKTMPTEKNASFKIVRLKIIRLVLQETEISVELLQQLLPEVILSTREINSKARNISMLTLFELGDKCVADTDTGSGKSRLKIFLDVISAGLALDPHFVATTLQSLSYLVNKLHKHITQPHFEELLETCILLFSHASQEVVGATLELTRVLTSSVPSAILSKKAEPLVTKLCVYSNERKNKLRLKVRVILDIISKSIGLDKIMAHLPPPLAKHMRKSIQKQKKGKQLKKSNKDSEGDDMEEDGDDDEDDLFQIPKKNLGNGTWVREGKSDSEVIDFLASSSLQHVVSSDPSLWKRKRDLEMEFDKSSDGKFIIEDPMEEENLPKKRKKEDRLVTNDMIGLSKKVQATSALPSNVETGERYKKKGVAGDVKGKSKFEPFAYIPLDPKQLNKRSRQTAHKRYQDVVKTKANKHHPTSGGIKKRTARAAAARKGGKGGKG
eukprot:TRINITY_DN5040_c0_g2_i8.p1 TRINITY_DN5040_c0_g2~~TRINITY_DN5040_c0_g2_i8.p1  ORF type:complete len:1038 (+),score=236.12 TRINITY_DN5040_c0_g2_i8:911-4024(+)